MLNITIDENIAYANEAFGSSGKVFSVNGRNIKNSDLLKTDALIIRSVTKVNEELFKDTPVKFVGTATIGTDHVDIDYLKENKIFFTDAKGCNADAVAEYIFTALFNIATNKNIDLKDISLGIIGVGNIGSRVARYAEAFGIKTLLNDPPLKRLTNDKKFVSLEETLKADIITFHVPLNIEGEDKTYHLLDEEKIKNLIDDIIIINASRGEVVDNKALLKYTDDKNFTVVLDVWENEPDINIELLKKVYLGSPHAAGYSLEGKVNGTKMIYNKFCEFFNINPEWKPNLPDVDNSLISTNINDNSEKKIYDIFKKIYNIESDNQEMKKMINIAEAKAAEYFDKLRKEYPLRREFNNYYLNENEFDEKEIKFLKKMRFEFR